jgi:hypothetical protein
VSDDLKPYTCYFPGCPLDNCFFDVFDSWEAHALSGHEVLKGWMCLFCDATDLITREEDFKEHIKSTHRDERAEIPLGHLLTACRVHEEPDLETCPVCSIDAKTWGMRKTRDVEFDLESPSFLRHIGKCMHDFTLLALPSTGLDGSDNEFSEVPAGVSHFDTRSSLSSVSLGFSARKEDRRGLAKSDVPEVSPYLKDAMVLIWRVSTQKSKLVSPEYPPSDPGDEPVEGKDGIWKDPEQVAGSEQGSKASYFSVNRSANT